MKGEVALTPSQIQATRLNELEHRRLRHNLDLLHEDFKSMLDRFQREKHDLKDHYTNVVRVVKPNPKYDLWKDEHAEDRFLKSSESMRRRSNFRTKLHKRAASSEDILEESTRPLLVLLMNHHRKKSIEPLIDFSADFLRPSTSPTKRTIPNIRRKNALTTMFQESKPHASPSVYPSSAHGIRQRQPASGTTENHSNLDAMYRMALQNQAACKSVDQSHIEKRKLLDRDFAKRHHAMRSTVHSAGCIK